MYDIGIGSLLIVALICIFIGAVTAIQFNYQLDGTLVPKYYIHGVYVLFLPHTAYLRCHIRSYFSSQYKTSDSWCHFYKSNVSYDIPDIICGYQCACHLVIKLYSRDGTNKY